MFCTQVLGLEVITAVNVAVFPASLLCSRSRNVFFFADRQCARRHYQILINYIKLPILHSKSGQPQSLRESFGPKEQHCKLRRRKINRIKGVLRYFH